MGIKNYFILYINMYKIFTSGSCRLMSSFNDVPNMICPIHTLHTNFIGKNFMGKLHDIEQHIQFVKYIKNL